MYSQRKAQSHGGQLLLLVVLSSCMVVLAAANSEESMPRRFSGAAELTAVTAGSTRARFLECPVSTPCNCTDGRAGNTRCDERGGVLCKCDRGFHWSKTDTIITICVCLGFGMLVKTVLLILYLRRKYMRRQQQHWKEGQAYDAGSAKQDQFDLDPKGHAYFPVAGTSSQSSRETVDNGKSEPLQIRIDTWRQLSPSTTSPATTSEAASRTGDDAPLVFTFKELQTATRNFNPTLLIGEGGFGRVYYGVLDGREVAVKRLEKQTTLPGKHDEKQFRVEVDLMSRLKHPNLLGFIGYCADGGERVLVYPLMVNQSLFRRLHDSAPKMEPLDCTRRVTIAYQAARALAYLHDETAPQVIHRDFNSSNVLLDENLDAKVSDFGMAKLVSDDSGRTQTTKLFGTMGYMAPEYLHGNVTVKNDVYSFGVFWLELISGRRAVISNDLDIVQWAAMYTKRNSEGLLPVMAVDPVTQDQWPSDALQWSVDLAAACIDADPKRRPKMEAVARALEIILQRVRNGTSPASTPQDGQAEEVAPFSMTEFLGGLNTVVEHSSP